MQTMTLRRPDDWHLHLRDGAMLREVVAATTRVMGRAIVMPNLKPPVVTAEAAEAYRERIRAAAGEDTRFEPLMTAYLTDDTDPDDLEEGFRAGVLTAVKLYPAGATTNSDSGVTQIEKIARVIERLEHLGMPLLVHGEVTHSDVDIFDREAVFIDEVLSPLLEKYPRLRVVFEHATTADAVSFVRSHGENVACTITPQHLLANRNDLLVGGIKPHYYCLPVLKRARHQRALLDAATSGEESFFLGTDSAPHTTDTKESSCGCAGCYTAPAAIELYALAFEGHLDKLEAFASLNGPRFYGLSPNSDTITLIREDWTVPEQLGSVVPFYAGRTLPWRLLP